MPPPTLQNNTPLPPLIYGTTLHDPPHPQPNITCALRHGFRAIDTASSLRLHDESSDGKALSEAIASGVVTRGEMLVQTKCTSPYGHPDDETLWPFNIEDTNSLRVLKSVARSVEELNVESIDVYFLHAPLGSPAETLEAWQTLEEVVRRGGIRYLGICNVDAVELERLWDEASVKPAFVQSCFAMRENGCDVDVVRFCRRKGIVYEVFGLFSSRNADLLEYGPVMRLSRMQGLTVYQALIRVLLEAARGVGLEMCILSGTTVEAHMEDNVAAAESEVKIEARIVEDFVQFLGWGDDDEL